MADDSAISMFRDSASGFLSGADQRQRFRALEAAGESLERSCWTQICALGWVAILAPQGDGGLDLGIDEVAVIAEQAGYYLLPEPFVDAGVHPVALLSALPASTARNELLQQILSGACLAGVAWQESAGEIEADLGLSNARHRDEQYLLNGQKRFVRPGQGADGWIVGANLDTELALFWLPRNAAGVHVSEAAGIDGLGIALLGFEDSPATLLARGPLATAALQQANDLTRIAQSAELLGIARRSLELTRDYMNTRVQFGKLIGSFQALQHRLVDGLIQVELATACLRDVLAARAHTPLAELASRVKSRCAWAATEMTRMAIQLHGAIGTTNEYDIGMYFKRAMTLASRLGNGAQHRQRWQQAHRGAQAAATRAATWSGTTFPNDLDWNALPEADFRAMVRALFAQHYPDARRHLPYRQTWAQSRDWYLTLARLGWLAPAWPREFGGMGLPADKLISYIEESEAWGIARPPDQGLVMVGPILMRFGNDEQRARFLPAILAGEQVWTQGYSEPNAGSDLAAVRTEAIIDGDEFVVTGQKTWTTWGADGTHMFMLVRTDKTVKKQAGISFVLVDLKSPGVTVRPIRNIAGESEFCEVFFDQVRVPRSNLVGELNQGWTIAKALLGFERLFTGSPKHSQYTLHQIEKLAQQRGLLDDAAFVERLTQLHLDTADLTAAYTTYAEIAKRGEPIPPGISMLKLWSTETHERLALLLIESAQDYGAFRDHCHTDEIDMHLIAPLMGAMNGKIFAGSNEIQRNILAKNVLKLPD